MNQTVILTDSTCDLTPEILNTFQIKVLPLYVSFKDETYKDGIDISTEQLYYLVDKIGVLPKTSAPSVGDFQEFFKPFIDKGKSIVYIGISSKLSSTIQSALIAKDEFPAGRIEIIDSLNLSSGVGLLALKAAKFRDQGLSVKEIANQIRTIIPKVETAFVIDTMEYLYKGGRCTGITNFVGTVLKIKPIIHVINGEMTVGAKPRGRIKAYELLLDKLFLDNANIDTDFIMVTHSLNYEGADFIKQEIQKILEFSHVFETTAGCVISSHCGKGTIGILYITK